MLAAVAFEELAAASAALAKVARKPTSRDVRRAIEHVAARLGNTPSVCRKCYVHPDVIGAYLDGTLAAALERRADGRTSREVSGLRPEEAAVLGLLKRRLRSGRAHG
jgi:DNA topoisomerase I